MAEKTWEIGLNGKWIVKTKLFCTEKNIEIQSRIIDQRDFIKEFKAQETRGRKTILKWVTKFRSLGTVESLNTIVSDSPTTSERPRIRSQELIDTVVKSIENSPKRVCATIFNISTFRRTHSTVYLQRT